MSGIYIHIPFCKQACNYCDFHFSTNLSLKEALVKSIGKEVELRAEYLKDKHIQSIYFGGGTPSLLNEMELSYLMAKLHTFFEVSSGCEITLEANPDDLDISTLKTLRANGINRLSIGIQTFSDTQLKYLNRSHNAKGSLNAIKSAQDCGFDNISIDLIYGIQEDDHTLLKADLSQAYSLGVQHISAYCLTVEKRTVFGHRLEKGELNLVNEGFAAEQFELLMDSMKKEGFEQYEISNFSKPDRISRHNSNYWLGAHYLGLGPSAHSFNGNSRQYNISNNFKYIQGINNELPDHTFEVLTPRDQINEHIMTLLRTKWGCDLNYLKKAIGPAYETFERILAKYLRLNLIKVGDNRLKLTEEGKLLADEITADLFII